jgi:GT2 family glycosyltransferase
MMENVKVTAVVVTFNRFELLQKVVESLKGQSRTLDEIVIVNNGSTDGTHEWLDAQEGITVIHQDNVGGSGGFARGIDYAYNHGADFIWCMDDDVFPRRECLENLLAEMFKNDTIGIVAPRRLMEGKIFCHDFREYNLSNPFASMYKGRLSKEQIDTPTEVKGTAFEGPMIRRSVVERIGLPNKELFIFCDDTDYCLRTVLIGYKILYVPAALMDKHKFFNNDTWAERNRKKKWKRFYQVRNSTYLNHHYGTTWGVRHLRGFIGVAGYLATAIVTMPFSKAYEWADLKKLWRAYRDGTDERLGKMEGGLSRK